MSSSHLDAMFAASSRSSSASFPLEKGSDPLTLSEIPPLIRTLRQHDLVTLADLLATSFHTHNGVQSWLYPVLRLGIYEDLRSRLQSPSLRSACLVAVKCRSPQLSALKTGAGEWIVGSVEIAQKTPAFWQARPAHYLYISNLAVRAECRRQGIAAQLLQTCERVGREWGFKDLYLHVLESNHPARRLYWKLGYRVEQIETNLATRILGRSRQLLMRKRLSNAKIEPHS